MYYIEVNYSNLLLSCVKNFPMNEKPLEDKNPDIYDRLVKQVFPEQPQQNSVLNEDKRRFGAHIRNAIAGADLPDVILESLDKSVININQMMTEVSDKLEMFQYVFWEFERITVSLHSLEDKEEVNNIIRRLLECISKLSSTVLSFINNLLTVSESLEEFLELLNFFLKNNPEYELEDMLETLDEDKLLLAPREILIKYLFAVIPFDISGIHSYSTETEKIAALRSRISYCLSLTKTLIEIQKILTVNQSSDIESNSDLEP